MKKTLIIVSNESDRKYATYLQQLISAFDDSDDKQIGTKDGSVDAVVWDEKHYRDNFNCLKSTNHILFIGDNESAREARSNMNVKFYAVGMSYGWLGSQAYMLVDDGSLNKDNYGEFKELCEKYDKTFKKELDLHFSPSEAEQQNQQAKPDDAIALLPVPLAFLSPVLGVASAAAIHGQAAVNMAGQALAKAGDMLQAAEAKDQQYSLLTLILYMDGLTEFLGE